MYSNPSHLSLGSDHSVCTTLLLPADIDQTTSVTKVATDAIRHGLREDETDKSIVGRADLEEQKILEIARKINTEKLSIAQFFGEEPIATIDDLYRLAPHLTYVYCAQWDRNRRALSKTQLPEFLKRLKKAESVEINICNPFAHIVLEVPKNVKKLKVNGNMGRVSLSIPEGAQLEELEVEGVLTNLSIPDDTKLVKLKCQTSTFTVPKSVKILHVEGNDINLSIPEGAQLEELEVEGVLTSLSIPDDAKLVKLKCPLCTFAVPKSVRQLEVYPNAVISYRYGQKEKEEVEPRQSFATLDFLRNLS